VSPKTLLIILIVIALVVGAAIVRGQRGEKKSDPEKPPGKDFFLFKWLQPEGDSLAMARLSGCGRDRRVLRWSGTCDARIAPGKPRQQSRFVLRATAGFVKACYGFNEQQVEDCDDDEDSRGRVKSDGESRFVVADDGAFLRLYCLQAQSGGCAVTVE
jgi:hypothetical protein